MSQARLRLVLLAGAAQLVWLAFGAFDTSTGYGRLMAITALALSAVMVAGLALAVRLDAISSAQPLVSRVRALRRKAWAAAFQRLLNPDSAGRPRPRAPSACPAAA